MTTKYYVVNSVRLVGRVILPGTLVDNGDADYQDLLQAGAVLWPAYDKDIAAASAEITRIRKLGAAEFEVHDVMQGGLAKKQRDSMLQDGVGNPWLKQPVWYIDGQNTSKNASDDNVGDDPAAPLKTKAELANRLASGLIAQATVVYLMSDEAPGDTCSLECKTDLNTLTFIGYRTLAAQGTFTNVSQASVPSPGNTGGSLAAVTDGSKPAGFWNAYANGQFIVENTTNGTFFEVNANLGGGSANISTPLTGFDARDFYNQVFSLTAIPNAVGDAYKVWKLAKHTFVRAKCGNNVGLLFQFVDLLEVVPGSAVVGTSLMEDAAFTNCTLRAAFTSQGIATQWMANCRITGQIAVVAQAIILGGIVDSFGFSSYGNYSFFDFDVIFKSFVKVAFGGQVTLASVYLEGFIDSRSAEGSLLLAGGSCSLAVAPLFSSPRVWGPGTIRVHPGDILRYSGTAEGCFRNAGGLDLDGGASAFTVDGSGVTSLRAVTPANIDAVIGAGGFSGSCQTVKGTRVVPVG